jgi:hypothetical protein
MQTAYRCPAPLLKPKNAFALLKTKQVQCLFYQSPVLHIIFLDNFNQPGGQIFLVAWIPAQPFVTSSDELSDSLSEPHMILLPFFASKNYLEAYGNFLNRPYTTAACLPRQYPEQTYHVPDHKPQSCTCHRYLGSS